MTLDKSAARVSGSRKSISDIVDKKLRSGQQWVAEKLLPIDRRCPRCKQLKIERRRWAVSGGMVICRSCSRLDRVGCSVSASDVMQVCISYRVDRFELAEKMRKKSYKGIVLARTLGWPAARVTRLLQGVVTKLTEREAKIIAKELGTKIFDDGSCYQAVGLKAVRASLGVSPRDFAGLCGWDLSKQRRIESGNVTVNATQAAQIMWALQELS